VGSFARGAELLRPVSVDRLHHADPCEDHWAIVLRGLGDATCGRLHLFHLVLGRRDFLGQPGDGPLERPQFAAIRQFDRFIEAGGETRTLLVPLFRPNFLSAFLLEG